MNHLFRSIVYILLVISLVACSGSELSPIVTIIVSPSITLPSLSIPTETEVNASQDHPELIKNTNTFAPSVTPTPVHTITFTATQTPTVTQTTIFNPSSIRTVTPAPAAKCPTPSSDIVPSPKFGNSKARVKPIDLMNDVLDFLNLFGAGAVYAEYKAELERGDVDVINWGGLNFSNYRDLTNDGVKDLVANLGGTLYIFGCQDGHYAVLDMREADAAMSFPMVIDVADANRNGIPEAILILGSYTDGSTYYQVIEWDGQEFQDLLVPALNENYSTDLFIQAGVESNLKHEDFDQDGIEEYIATIGIPVGETYSYGIPWRKETQIYKWNGRQFVSYRRIFTAPEYRFQAVQDGDRATLEGEYEKALDFYQQAVFSDKLEWWSPERYEFLMRIFLGSLYKTNEPTPVPPILDPNEYDNLAAYARYRIMLLHLARGWVSDAKVVYDTLQKKYPLGKPGHDYAVLAETVWTEFEQSKDLGKACVKGVKFASYRPVEIYYYIGGSRDPGNHGIDYNLHPDFICPFH